MSNFISNRKEVLTIKVKYLLVILIILLFIAGCGKKECSSNSDCKEKDCYTTRCVRGKCVSTAENNCCGNNKCEDKVGENKCTCSKDCGECSGSEGEYLQYLCDEYNNCIVSYDEDEVEERFLTDRVPTDGPVLLVTYSYDFPFDLKSSTFKVSFQPESYEDAMYGLVITSIRVKEYFGKSRSKSAEEINILGQKDINKGLFSRKHALEEEIVLDFYMNSSEEEKEVEVEVFYEFEEEDRRGNLEKESDSFSKVLSNGIVFVIPDKDATCQSCDDNNPCTIDTCSGLTNYFCNHNMRPGECCGNFICDDDETKCSCQKDCGDCQHDFGEYMEFVCSDNECVSTIRDKDSIEKKTLMEEKSVGDFTFLLRTEYNSPFNHKKDSYRLNFEILKKEEDAVNLKLIRIQLLEGIDLLGEETYSETLSEVGNSETLSIRPSFTMKDPEIEISPTIKVYYEYTYSTKDGTETQVSSFSKSLGKIISLNPDI